MKRKKADELEDEQQKLCLRLRSMGLPVRLDWIKAYHIHTASKSNSKRRNMYGRPHHPGNPNSNSTDPHSLPKDLYKELMHSDFHSVAGGCLPNNVGNMHKQVLKGKAFPPPDMNTPLQSLISLHIYYLCCHLTADAFIYATTRLSGHVFIYSHIPTPSICLMLWYSLSTCTHAMYANRRPVYPPGG